MNRTSSSGAYLSYTQWFKNVIDEDIILCGTSSLELQDMFNGSSDEKTIEAYALIKGQYDNINYHIVNSFNDIECCTLHGIKCTTFNQTINDMLSNDSLYDLWAITEALSNYYYSHNETFNDLIITEQNTEKFEAIKQDAINYYNEG